MERDVEALLREISAAVEEMDAEKLRQSRGFIAGIRKAGGGEAKSAPAGPPAEKTCAPAEIRWS